MKSIAAQLRNDLKTGEIPEGLVEAWNATNEYLQVNDSQIETAGRHEMISASVRFGLWAMAAPALFLCISVAVLLFGWLDPLISQMGIFGSGLLLVLFFFVRRGLRDDLTARGSEALDALKRFHRAYEDLVFASLYKESWGRLCLKSGESLKQECREILIELAYDVLEVEAVNKYTPKEGLEEAKDFRFKRFQHLFDRLRPFGLSDTESGYEPYFAAAYKRLPKESA